MKSKVILYAWTNNKHSFSKDIYSQLPPTQVRCTNKMRMTHHEYIWVSFVLFRSLRVSLSLLWVFLGSILGLSCVSLVSLLSLSCVSLVSLLCLSCVSHVTLMLLSCGSLVFPLCLSCVFLVSLMCLSCVCLVSLLCRSANNSKPTGPLIPLTKTYW